MRDVDYDEQGLPEKREGPSCAKLGDKELIIPTTIVISTIISDIKTFLPPYSPHPYVPS